MAAKTNIAWTDATWGPLYGCSRVSKGCENCYAEQVVGGLARKFKEKNPKAFEFYSGLTKETSNGPRWTGVVKVHEEHLLQPLRWQKPRRVFVNSLSDVFHDAVSERDILRIFAVMAACPDHTFQILTKRPKRMQALLSRLDWALKVAKTGASIGVFGEHPDTLFDQVAYGRNPFFNVWLGVSIEDQKAADERIPLLLQAPAAVRFLSCEPLLGPIDLEMALEDFQPLNANLTRKPAPIQWVIAGGESGANFRPLDLDWARSLRDQCVSAGVAFFFKQDSDRKSGQRAQLDGKEWHQFPGEVSR